MSERTKGTVKWFDPSRGYGFIRLESGEDAFVHHSAIQDVGFRVLQEGELVEFEVETDPKGPRAVNVDRGEYQY